MEATRKASAARAPLKREPLDRSSSDAVIHDRTAYIAAQVPDDGLATVAEQTQSVLDKLDAVLARCGTSKRKLLTATVYCSDSRHFDEVNTRWDAWVPWHDRRAASTSSPSFAPARTRFRSRSSPRSDFPFPPAPAHPAHQGPDMKLSYRDRVKLLGGASIGLGLQASGLAALAGWAGAAEAQGDAGGTLRWALTPEPPSLVTAFNSAQMVQQISAKIMDGLVAYDRKLRSRRRRSRPRGRSPTTRATVTFKLRDSVKWHDGAPFTSADVKYTFEEVLKKHHPRGRATFANLEKRRDARQADRGVTSSPSRRRT